MMVHFRQLMPLLLSILTVLLSEHRIQAFVVVKPTATTRPADFPLVVSKHSLMTQRYLAENHDFVSENIVLGESTVWIVFGIGLIPFVWATVEFWSRIAVGKPFGTSQDTVYIGKDNAPESSRGKRVLDRGAFVVAYILFAIAASVVGLSLYSVLSAGGSAPIMEQ